MERYLGGLQGRKNLIWFSGSFPLTLGGDPNDQVDRIPETMLLDEFKDTLTMMSRSQVAVYPVDAVGLRSDPMNDAESNGGLATGPSGSLIPQATASQKQQEAAAAQDQQTKTQAINSSHNDFNGEVANAYGEMKKSLRSPGASCTSTPTIWPELFKMPSPRARTTTQSLTSRPIPQRTATTARSKSRSSAKESHSLTVAGITPTIDKRALDWPSPLKAGSEAVPYNAFNAAMTRGAPEPTEIIFLALLGPSTADSSPPPLRQQGRAR